MTAEPLRSLRPKKRPRWKCLSCFRVTTDVLALTNRSGKVGFVPAFLFSGGLKRRSFRPFSIYASAESILAQERMPLWKDFRSYFSLGE